MTTIDPRPRRTRSRGPVERPHGWRRASDLPEPAGGSDEGRRSRAPAGTSLLLGLLVGVLAAIGIVRVHASARVLELGAQIAELTAEHARLQENKRRLSAERAYRRRPSQVTEAARQRLGLVPVAPELVQTIRLVEESPNP